MILRLIEALRQRDSIGHIPHGGSMSFEHASYLPECWCGLDVVGQTV